MKITRKYTVAGQDPFATTEWVKRSSKIMDSDGSVVFEMADAEVPSGWSQLATDIMVSKYFRKAGVPQVDGRGMLKTDERGSVMTGPERSAKQVIHRLAGCWRHWGERHNYFDSADDAQAFYDEMVYMLVHQVAAPNSPQWFNTGLNWAYGITGPAQGHWYVDPATGEPRKSDDAYHHPQPHACFIQSVDDDLVNDGGIMDLWVREARLFKYGSGTGTNFSKLRAENELLAGGGRSSGLMSWLKIGDRAAGAIKSGGTTRRAAKMVCLDMDHPDIVDFINWKVREELKVAALVEGAKALKAADETYKQAAERLGLDLTYDFNGESYQTVSGQNSNNSVRIPDAFFDAVDNEEPWAFTERTSGNEAGRVDATMLWDDIGYAAWKCADPGVQYDSTINAWHTCPNSGRINASNPCSEYMFLDNTACNLASLNLLTFFNADDRTFDAETFEHAVDLWTIVLEISVLMAQFPSREIAELSYKYRTLGLGYANLGAMLMRAGVPYDSVEARALAGCITSILTGRSYRMSALMASEHGAFPGYERNRDHMLRVIRNHRRAAHGVSRDSDQWESLRIAPVPIDHEIARCAEHRVSNARVLLHRATAAWDDALAQGTKFGFRNAQVSVIAPTGTIGLLMDCDTTGVEPDFALVKFKKLAGGGYFKIANQSIEPALKGLGYDDGQCRDILRYVMGTLTLDTPLPAKDGSDAPAGGSTLRHFLKAKGLGDETIDAAERSLPSVFELRFAFSAWAVPEQTLRELNIDPAAARADRGFDLLRRLGLTAQQVDALNVTICGTQTVEGAPHLDEEHLPVFDCANPCGKTGVRFIEPEGHIRMMAAAQPFISGAISKTINLPNSATVEDVQSAYRLSWELGLKANALYRDGCKLSQPLSTKSDSESSGDAEDEAAVEAEKSDAAFAEMEAAAIEDADGLEAARDEVAEEVVGAADAAGAGETDRVVEYVERIVQRPMRKRLPDTRRSMTHKFNVAGHEGYLTVGLYDDGTPGELFITMAKEGSTIGGLMDSLGTATSVALQYGVPIDSLVKKFTHQRFEPAGMTTNREIPFAKSLVDYIFRWMGMNFVEGYREANAPQREQATTDTAGVERSGSIAAAAGNRGIGESDRTTSAVGGRMGVTNGDSGGSRISNAVHGNTVRKAEADAERLGVAEVDEAQSPRLRLASMEDGEGASSRNSDTAAEASAPTAQSQLSAALATCQEDAPACDACGAVTVRNGTCYRCMNCGASMGCS